MAFGTIDLYPSGRRKCGTVIMGLCLAQFIIGISILGCAIYFLQNLHWRLSVAHNRSSYSFGVVTLVTGSAISFIHLCAAKIFYDSGRDATRHRFEFLLFPVVMTFVVLLVFEFALLITSTVHRNFPLDHFRQGFLKGISGYPHHAEHKASMDRLQLEDQCCGADHFMDWIEADWVAPAFNPLSDPNMDFREKSAYWPWSLLAPVGVAPAEEMNYEPPQKTSYDLSSGSVNVQSNSNNAPPITTSPRPLHVRMPRRLKRSANKRLSEKISKRQKQMSGDARMETYAERFPPYENREHLSIVPWSCCSVDYSGPCVHDYVTQRILPRELGVREFWNGESLSQRGCAPLLQARYRSYSQACLIIFAIAFILQVAILIPARYLQTAVENLELYNREDNSSPAYLLPCSWFGGVDYKSIAKHKVKVAEPHDFQDSGPGPDQTSVSLADEYDNLKRKKRSKRRKLKDLLMPTRKQRNEIDDDNNEASSDEGNAIEDAHDNALKPLRNQKSKGTQMDGDEEEEDYARRTKKQGKARKLLEKGKRLFASKDREKRKRLKQERPQPRDEEVEPLKSKAERRLRTLSPKNLYKKMKKGTERFLEKRSKSRLRAMNAETYV